MKTTTNKDMLNAIRNQASAEYQERMPEVKGLPDAEESVKVLNDYPSIKNEFIETLINKVVRTDFFSKVYENPLKMLKKGHLPYGASIEELFVAAATEKGFLESGYDKADALVGTKKATVERLYITKNFAYVFDVTISEAQLKTAFMSANGLSELVNQLVGSLTSGAEQKEYSDMIEMIKAAADAKMVKTAADGKVEFDDIPSGKGVKQAMAIEKIVNDPKSITKAVRALAGRMKFVSPKYNMAQVKTWSRPEDLVFLTTPEIMADLDVNVLAQAFNVSSAEVNVRTILVDELPKELVVDGSRKSDKPCLGILMDKQFVQAIDTVNESRSFENGRTLSRNIFLHKQGILANCYFANAVALIEK